MGSVLEDVVRGIRLAVEVPAGTTMYEAAEESGITQHFPELATPAARLACGALARDLMLDTGGAAYLALPAVKSELNQGRLFRVPDAPVITRCTFAVCRPADQAREEVQQALESLPSSFRGSEGTPE